MDTTQPRWLETYRIKVARKMADDAEAQASAEEERQMEHILYRARQRQAFMESLTYLMDAESLADLTAHGEMIQADDDDLLYIDSGPYRFVYANRERYDGTNNKHVPAIGVFLERAMPDIYVKLLEAYLAEGYYNRPEGFRLAAREHALVHTDNDLVKAMILLDNKHNEAHRAAQAEEERRATAQPAELQKPLTVVDTPREYTNMEGQALDFLKSLISDIEHDAELNAGQTQVLGLAASLASPL